ncbi:DUF3263 domain-containing protein [Nocardioides fonticola]
MLDSQGLSDRDRAMLDLERQWWKYPAAKETVVREIFDISITKYFQRLDALLDDPAALAHDPQTVRRLQRLRAARAAQRRGRPA